MVRMTVGTHQDHGSRQASASFITRKRVRPDGFLTFGSHATVNVVNKRDNCTRSGRHPGRSSACNIFRDREGYQLGCAGAVARLAQAFISYVYHMTSPVFFLSEKMASQAILFFAE